MYIIAQNGTPYLWVDNGDVLNRIPIHYYATSFTDFSTVTIDKRVFVFGGRYYNSLSHTVEDNSLVDTKF